MNIGGRRKRYLQSFQGRESPSVGLWHHEHHEDGVGGADAGEVDEEAPGAQQGHHSCCHLYLGAGWFMLMALLRVKVIIMALMSMIMAFRALKMPTNSTDIG